MHDPPGLVLASELCTSHIATVLQWGAGLSRVVRNLAERRGMATEILGRTPSPERRPTSSLRGGSARPVRGLGQVVDVRWPMTVSYVDSNRREDLRAAALFVVDEERQAHGYDKRVRGSAGVPDVIRTFDETLAVFPLESEVGDAIRSAEELPCWRNVLERMEPIWKLWPSYSSKPPALLETEEWAMLREAVQRCVDMHRLWNEEIEFPVTVVNPQGGHHQATSWHELDRLDHAAIAGATIEDARGRRIDLELGPPRTLRRVGLPRPSGQ